MWMHGGLLKEGGLLNSDEVLAEIGIGASNYIDPQCTIPVGNLIPGNQLVY